MMPAHPLPSQIVLQELFHYEPSTGALTWRRWKGGTAHAGTTAGTPTPTGYIRVNCCGKLHMAHRLIWKLVTGDEPPEEIDHIDCDGSNNRWNNLRAADRADNAHNTRKPVTNTSGFKGVHWDTSTNRWCAQIKARSESPIYLGTFDTPEAAHAAYCRAAVLLHGQFARFE